MILRKLKVILKPGLFVAAALTIALVPSHSSFGRSSERLASRAKIHIAFQWHMHQPIYWPYESVLDTIRHNRYSYSLHDVFASRTGPYTGWPFNAVKMAEESGLPHGGAQVSFSGSLIENLNVLAGSNSGFQNWSQWYSAGRKMKTARGNPRMDLVAFGYHHPMMPLISYRDIRDQIQAHREIIQRTFGGDVSYSKGMFPPENAFAEWMIPALVDENIQWVFVDNIHFNRANANYPHTKGENLFAPNPAEQRNNAVKDDEWFRVHGLWAPSEFSAWAERPHWIAYRDPKTGEVARTPDGKVARMIAVPTERYLGNEDGRGGFGALNYEKVMAQFEDKNTDAAHPILLVLHHDGDNYGGGTWSYYSDNFRRFVDWVKANPDRFEFTTVQDYLDRFPPAEDDVIHVEPGSWSGADNGDPEFKKWFGDPNADGYSYDRNSWAVMTAAENIIRTAEADPTVPRDVVRGAKRFHLVSQTSCYEYWDGTEDWDTHPTRASNQTIRAVQPYLTRFMDRVGPSILIPQREPYNPGLYEWGQNPEPSDFEVWTYAFDLSGLEKVSLRYRIQKGKKFPQERGDFSMNAGTWNEMAMESRTFVSRTTEQPLYKANEFFGKIRGVTQSLVSYYVVAVDKYGNENRSELLHVYVGDAGASGPDLVVEPGTPSASDAITITSNRPGTLHWGVNSWTVPHAVYWPQGSVVWGDGKAVRTPLLPTADGRYAAKVGPFNRPEQAVREMNFIINYSNGAWGPKDTRIIIR